MSRILLISILFLLIQSCSIIRPYKYEICVKESEKPSQLRQNELIGIADTTVVNIIGQILDDKTSEKILFATSYLRNESSNITTCQVVDSLGQFHFSVNPGQYYLNVKCIGYTELDTLLTLKSGEIRNFRVALGEAGGYTMYHIKSCKKLSDKELNEAALK